MALNGGGGAPPPLNPLPGNCMHWYRVPALPLSFIKIIKFTFNTLEYCIRIVNRSRFFMITMEYATVISLCYQISSNCKNLRELKVSRELRAEYCLETWIEEEGEEVGGGRPPTCAASTCHCCSWLHAEA